MLVVEILLILHKLVVFSVKRSDWHSLLHWVHESSSTFNHLLHVKQLWRHNTNFFFHSRLTCRRRHDKLINFQRWHSVGGILLTRLDSFLLKSEVIVSKNLLHNIVGVFITYSYVDDADNRLLVKISSSDTILRLSTASTCVNHSKLSHLFLWLSLIILLHKICFIKESFSAN